ERPTYDIPSHPVADGAAFLLADPAALGELARWYDGADAVLRALQSDRPQASPVRCWPHHFDIATLITVAAKEADREARTLGVGLSPGDDSYAEPYWYVTPWPFPEDRQGLAPLSAGSWREAGWFGAVLRGTEIVTLTSASEQADRVGAFLESAITACQAI